MNETTLFDTLETSPGVGSSRYRILQKLGLHRIVDALFFFPRGYEDHSEIVDIGEIRDGDSASVVGEIVDHEKVEKGGGRSSFYLLIQQGNHYLRGIWFNQPYRANKVDIGKKVMLSGTAKLSGMRPEMIHPKMIFIDENEDPQRGTLLPIYRLTEGIKQAELRRLIRSVVESNLALVDEIFPEAFLLEKRLLGIKDALRMIHLPENSEEIDPARNRFVYQELLTLQLAINLRRAQVSAAERAPEMEIDSRVDARIKNYFPYQLTGAQEFAIKEIASDMSRLTPMNRMLHGDVGCGKTAVAVYALMLAVACGHQGVLMAPTETLARQHYRNLQTMLAQTRVKVGLLTGTLSAPEKRRVVAEIESGELGIVIGTQALIQNELSFHRLGLVIVDEQHRFGVKQRAQLRDKGITPHYLVMTATPIPRTISMTLFGDLDVSVLHEKPPNRLPINTYLCQQSQREKWWDFVRKKVREGRQAYVIAPLVDEDERGTWENVEEVFESLSNGEFADFKIDLLHGRQSSDEKEAAMVRFADGATQVLVATSVVEVGIDVPNATVMTILSASRFGLAQLHQLRGRVGRGRHAGFMAMFADVEAEDVNERLQALVETNDGFKLAEIDFQMRGPGDLFGTKQHGMPPLFVADLQRDFDLLVSARNDAQQILSSDPDLGSEEFSAIKQRVISRYGSALDLVDVG